MAALRERIGRLITAIWGPQDPDTLEGLIDQTIEANEERRAA